MAKIAAKHPYISQDKQTCGGSLIIKGTRMRVIDIVIEYEYLGYSPDEIVNAHPHLNLPQVHDVLSYYYEHRKEIDQDIRKRKKYIQGIEKLSKKER